MPTFYPHPVFVPPCRSCCTGMKLNRLLIQLRPGNAKVIVSFGNAHLLRVRDGKFELRGGNRAERQAVREWVSYFLHNAAVEW